MNRFRHAALLVAIALACQPHAAPPAPSARDAGAGGADAGASGARGADAGTGASTDAGSVSTSLFFPAGAEWTRDISHAALDSESAAVITGLAAAGGFGTGRM